jgi:hypothetical protein
LRRIQKNNPLPRPDWGNNITCQSTVSNEEMQRREAEWQRQNGKKSAKG